MVIPLLSVTHGQCDVGGNTTYGYLPSRKASPPIGWYQIILLGDRGIRVLTTCPGLHSIAERPGFELATYWSQVQRPNHSANEPHGWYLALQRKFCQQRWINCARYPIREGYFDDYKYVLDSSFSSDRRNIRHVSIITSLFNPMSRTANDEHFHHVWCCVINPYDRSTLNTLPILRMTITTTASETTIRNSRPWFAYSLCNSHAGA